MLFSPRITSGETPDTVNSHPKGRAAPAFLQSIKNRIVWVPTVGLLFTFVFEILARSLAPDVGGIAILKPLLSLFAVWLFAITALIATNQIPGAVRARWTIVAAISGLITCQTIAVVGRLPVLYGVPIIGFDGYLHKFVKDVTFVGGFCLILAGFYMLVIELAGAMRKAQADRERMREEVEERRQIEAALRDTKERYSKIFESTDEAILILNEGRRILQFNPRFADMLGYSPGELTRADTLSLIHPLDRAVFAEHHRRLMGGHDVVRSFEFRMLHRTRGTIYVCGGFDRITRNETIICSHGIIRDITKLKEAQQAQLYRLQLESIIGTTSTKFISSPSEKLDENILSSLREVGEFIGADRAYVFQFTDDLSQITYTHEWLRQGISSCRDVRERPSMDKLQRFASAMLAGDVYHIPSVDALPEESRDERAILRDQDIRSVVAVPMSFQGSLVGLVGIDFVRAAAMVSDDTISLLKTVGETFAGSLIRERTQRALAQSEEKYRRILESIIEGYYEVDLSGRLLFFNDALETITGYTAEELRQGQLRDLFPAEVAVEVALVLDTIRQTGVASDALEWPIIRKNRELGFIEASGAPIFDEHGETIGYRGIIRDVTERHLAEEERQQLQQSMQQAQKLESLGMLAGGIAHDFNNLLMGVMANASIALEEIPPDSPAKRSLESIELSAQRAADLANQMLTYAGRARFVVEPLDVSSVVEEMANLLQATTSKRVSLHFDLDRTMPAIEGDPVQVRQVVMNLITNASEAMEGRDGVIDLKTYLTTVTNDVDEPATFNFEISPGRYVCVEVRDEGCGMDESTRERIFDPFFTSKFTGRGLGLATVMGIVRGHKGAVIVESELGAGTTFRILFPASDAQIPAVSAAVRITEPFAGDGTVLVVDDEELILDVTQRILERSEFRVLTARDGFECCDIVREHGTEIVAILLDMTMPRMNGVETFEEILKLGFDIPVILTSGFNEHDARDHFGGNIPAGFIQKPYRAQDLILKIQDVLNLMPAK